MSKQVLSVEQMQYLQELGLDTSNASLYYYKQESWEANYFIALTCDVMEKGGLIYYYDSFCNKEYILNEVIPAYTLQDVLDALPKEIKYKDKSCWPCIDLTDEFVGYYYEDTYFAHKYVYREFIKIDEGLIDASYRLLCWAIEHGFIETNKNE